MNARRDVNLKIRRLEILMEIGRINREIAIQSAPLKASIEALREECEAIEEELIATPFPQLHLVKTA
jgi:hypothetical protein